MSRLFLSYRRSDSPDTVKLLHERLKARLPQWAIFYDHSSIPAGERFPERLKTEIENATVVLAMIGPRWLDSLHERSHANKIDHVREELSLALESGRLVVPVPVQNTRLPSAEDLAKFPDLLAVPSLNGRPLRPEPDFDGDFERLVAFLEPLGPSVDIGTVLGGKYKLVRLIGEGGMGVVYRAEQLHPTRTVAVKLIKPGLDTKDVLARFDAERQALAMMNHPNIAGVIDAGQTPAGRPYFAMDYVAGVPITDYCDDKRLSPNDRLALFAQVCDAVQHAHQKGIIHRDIKPTNVLVETIDGKPVPKVIDFGLAKALSFRLTDKTLVSEAGRTVGTLLYSSPEQAAGRVLDIDTRTDIYSLGILLYEMLAGSPPFSQAELEAAGDDAMKRLIREQDPPTPSTRLSSSNALPAIAAKRNLEPGKLTKQVRGELDWIVMKALEKETDRRYATAASFAEDVGHYLKNEPVSAGKPSAGYRLRKFVRRNRLPVIAASLLVLALTGGIVGTTLGYLAAKRSEQAAVEATNQKEFARAAEADRAEGERRAKVEAEHQKTIAMAAAEAEKAANRQAQKRLGEVAKSNEILGSIFENLDPKEIAKSGRPLQAVLVQKLDQAVEQLQSEAIGDSLVVAEMQNRLGRSLVGLGEYRKAIIVYERALATRKARLGDDHLDTITSMHNLAAAYKEDRQLKIAIPLFEAVLEKRKAKLGDDHNATLLTMNYLGMAYENDFQAKKAIPLHEIVLEKRKVKQGADHPDTLSSMSNLANAYQSTGRVKEAILLYETTLEARKIRLGADHLDTLISMNNLAVAYIVDGRGKKAIPLYEIAFENSRAKLGEEHPTTRQFMTNLASAYESFGQRSRAIALYELDLEKCKTSRGEDHPDTLTSRFILAWAYIENQQGEKAVPVMDAYIKQFLRTVKPTNAEYAIQLSMVSGRLLKADQFVAAEAYLKESLTIRRKLNPNHWAVFETESLIGWALLGQKKYEAAEPLLLNGYIGMKVREQAIPLTVRYLLAEAADRLIALYAALNKPDEVRKWRAERAHYRELAPAPRSGK